MKCCLNCANYHGDHFCSFNAIYIPHPLFSGGDKCECYEKPKKYKLVYPKKEMWGYAMNKDKED